MIRAILSAADGCVNPRLWLVQRGSRRAVRDQKKNNRGRRNGAGGRVPAEVTPPGRLLTRASRAEALTPSYAALAGADRPGSAPPRCTPPGGSSITDTQQILDAVPTGVPVCTAAVAAAIDGCLTCVQTCTTCANADLAEEDVAELRVCAALCITCADVCDVTARVLSRPAQWDQFIVHHLLQACVHACESSAEECARHAHHHRHCAICEKVCRACTQACAALLDTQTIDNAQDLAGA